MPKSGACLQKHWRRWRQLSPLAGRWVKEGFRLPFLRRPTPCKIRTKQQTAEEAAYIDKAVADQLQRGAIYKQTLPREQLVLSPIGTVPKKDSDKRRPIFNLRWLNSHVRSDHFKMPSMKDVKAAITKDCYMSKIDLTDCFWGLPIAEDHQRFLSFEWRGEIYSYRCLPFGLNVAPLAITKLYRNMVEHLGSRGHRLIMYIDDILILGRTKEECDASVSAVRTLLRDLGAVVNEDKSSSTSTQQIDYLGFSLDSTTMTISAPDYKIKNTRKQAKRFLKSKLVSPRDIASLLGKVVSLADAMLTARVHTTGLKMLQLQILETGKGWDYKIPPSTDALADAKWWVENLHTMNGKSLLPPKPDVYAATDASDFGWGAWLQFPNQKTISWGGQFTAPMAQEHINYKELMAIFYFIRSFPTLLRGKTVDLGVDNTTALWYVRRMGGRNAKLARLAEKIFECLSALSITLMPYHIPGEQNVLADRESRTYLSAADWQLQPGIFQAIDEMLGPHSIDLFASFQDRQIQRFSSRLPQPDACFIDAMQHDWTGELGWANPPFPLIGRILQKVEQERSTITLLAPLWPAQAWYPQLLSMLVEPPLLLPQVDDLFMQVEHNKMHHKSPRWLTLACKISGDPLRRKEFSKKLSTCCSKRGRLQLWTSMTRIGGAGQLTPAAKAKIQLLATTLCSMIG